MFLDGSTSAISTLKELFSRAGLNIRIFDGVVRVPLKKRSFSDMNGCSTPNPTLDAICASFSVSIEALPATLQIGLISLGKLQARRVRVETCWNYLRAVV